MCLLWMLLTREHYCSSKVILNADSSITCIPCTPLRQFLTFYFSRLIMHQFFLAAFGVRLLEHLWWTKGYFVLDIKSKHNFTIKLHIWRVCHKCQTWHFQIQFFASCIFFPANILFIIDVLTPWNLWGQLFWMYQFKLGIVFDVIVKV